MGNSWSGADPARLVIAGDWHANGFHAARAVEWAAEQGADVIVHVGDFGYDFRPAFLNFLQAALEETGMLLGTIPGNHENYNYFDRHEARHGHTAIPLRPNIFYLPKGYRWEWSGVRFLGLGGAHSVDRPWRRRGVSWWPQETISPAQAEAAKAGGPADVMITHDVPAGVRIPAIEGNPHGFPEEEIDASERHRVLLRDVVDVVRPRFLYAGHYHCQVSDTLLGDGYRTEVTILADDSAPLADNLRVVDLAALR